MTACGPDVNGERFNLYVFAGYTLKDAERLALKMGPLPDNEDESEKLRAAYKELGITIPDFRCR